MREDHFVIPVIDSSIFCYYIKCMEIEYDKNKNQRNIKERGLPFTMVKGLEWSAALIWRDQRKEYGEARWSALVPRKDRLYFISYTWRGERMRIISFRKANNREIDRYEKDICS